MVATGLRVLLISTYELGRQPFGVASAASWLREAGAVVDSLDLAVERLDESAVSAADLVAFHVPMHTATRIAIERLPRVSRLNPRAHVCFFGLYAPVNEAYLRKLGVHTVLGGEFETGLRALAERLADGGSSTQQEQVVSLAKQQFRLPDRRTLPSLNRYAKVELPDGEHLVIGYTEATRGCLHRCRHCPIVPVYDGRFRVVQRQVVASDIRQQVEQGARHITFGDPDFFNGRATVWPSSRPCTRSSPTSPMT